MTNDVFTLDENNNAAIRTVGATASSPETNSPSVFTTDENGNAAIRVTGGGDQHNLGYYATPAALAEAHATAEAGDWAIVGSTDTVWIWDTDTSAWKDSDQKGQVVSVNNKTGTVVLNASDVGAVPQYTTMPTASSANYGEICQYIGEPDETYMKGYFYECVSDIGYDGTVEFNPASISGTIASCSGSDFANFLTSLSGETAANAIKGTITYYESEESDTSLALVAQDDTDNIVGFIQLNIQEFENYGFSFAGTLQDGDVITFTCSIIESPTYYWMASEVQTPQPIPECTQTYTFDSLPNPDEYFNIDLLQFIDTTNGIFTSGYFYECVDGAQSAQAGVISRKSDGSPSGLTLTVDPAVLETQGNSRTKYTFYYINDNWINSTTFSVVDLADYGITCTGTPEEGDIIDAFFFPATFGRHFAQIDVQPAGATIDDTSTSSLTATWSANKLNTVLGDVETLLSQI